MSCVSRGWVLYFASLLWLVATSAAAQVPTFSVDHHHLPPSHGDGIFVELPGIADRYMIEAKLAFTYQNEPLILEVRGARFATPIEHRLTMIGSLAVGMTERLGFFLQMPVTLWQQGDYLDVKKNGLGDLELGAQALFVGDGQQGFQLGASISLVQPTGESAAFSSDGDAGARLTMRAAYLRDDWTIGLHLGSALRPTINTLGYATGTDLFVAAGIYYQSASWLRVGSEFLGGTGLNKGRAFTQITSHTELGASLQFTPTSAWAITLGAAAGLTRGAGTPVARTFLSISYRTEAVGL